MQRKSHSHTRKPSKTLIAFGIAAATLATLLPTGISYAGEPKVLTAPCRDVEAVFARGSGQEVKSEGGEANTFRDELDERLGDGIVNFYELGSEELDGNQYPAVPVDSLFNGGVSNAIDAFLTRGQYGKYGLSVNEGVEELIYYLTERVETCGDDMKAIVLAGYSQGAQLINEAWRHKGMTAEVRGKVVFNALFGDPKLWLPEGGAGGASKYPPACSGFTEQNSEWRRRVQNCETNQGSLFAHLPYVPDEYSDRTGLWCNSEDFVCGSNGTIGTITGHELYGKNCETKHSVTSSADRDELFDCRQWNGDYAITPISEAITEIVDRLKVHNHETFNGEYTTHKKLQEGKTPGVDIVFLIDSTGSMQPRIDGAKKFANDYAKEIAAQRGRVALVEFRDDYANVPAKVLSDFHTDTKDFSRRLANVNTNGSGNLEMAEGQLHGLMTAFNGLSWRNGATKAAVILTDAGFKSPDPTDGSTVASVAARALEIDPVNVFAVVPEQLMDDYAELAEATTGAVFSDDSGDSSAALAAALERIGDRPVALIAQPAYYIPVGGEIRFDVSESFAIDADIVSYAWDFNGDGVFDETNTEPVMVRAYDEAFTGTMQVRVTDTNGIWSNISSFVYVGTSPSDLVPDAATELKTEDLNGVPDGKVKLTWDSEDDRVVSWLVSVDGFEVGVTEAETMEAVFGDIDRTVDTIFTVTGIDEDGKYGARASIEMKGDPDAVVAVVAGEGEREAAVDQGMPLPLLIVILIGVLVAVALIVTGVTLITRRVRQRRRDKIAPL